MCVVESNRQTGRDRCKGGWEKAASNQGLPLELVVGELEIKEHFYLRKNIFSSETISRSLWERWNQNPQPKWAHRQREQQVQSGRIEKHVCGYRASQGSRGLGQEDFHGEAQGRQHRWVLPRSRGAVSLQPLHLFFPGFTLLLQPSSFRPSSFMFARGLQSCFINESCRLCSGLHLCYAYFIDWRGWRHSTSNTQASEGQ